MKPDWQIHEMERAIGRRAGILSRWCNESAHVWWSRQCHRAREMKEDLQNSQRCFLGEFMCGAGAARGLGLPPALNGAALTLSRPNKVRCSWKGTNGCVITGKTLEGALLLSNVHSPLAGILCVSLFGLMKCLKRALKGLRKDQQLSLTALKWSAVVYVYVYSCTHTSTQHQSQHLKVPYYTCFFFFIQDSHISFSKKPSVYRKNAHV